ncbi:kynurenine--oxoglutarate transaminase 1 [Quercus suber]|uniref:Kynurenine--oxoglutarate transaminase 1 n=1 Tax=Quercus suber TaxID=58331 RepID=A0AAW0LGU2_QUESU
MAGGVPVFVALDPPHWTLDPNKLMKSITGRTKAIVLNSPQNPTGKVFTKDELEIIAGICRARDCLAITDEVYEHITFDNEKHISLASFPGMQERTIITSSLSKTFSVTAIVLYILCSTRFSILVLVTGAGWRVGWAIAPAFIASAIRNIHDYEAKRDYIVKLLAGVGFKIQFKPQGSFFLFAEIPENCPLSDLEYVKELIQQAGVVAVPGRGFFHTNLSLKKSSEVDHSYQKRYIRFAFCKSNATLAAAAQKLLHSKGLTQA